MLNGHLYTGGLWQYQWSNAE